MADRYWVGDGGNWNDTGHWSTASGGASGASVPGASDNAIIDGNSGTGTITANVAIDVLLLNFTSAQQLSFDQNGQDITVSGDATFDSDGTGSITLDGDITIDADADVLLTSNWSAESATSSNWDIQGTGNIDLSNVQINDITCGYAGKTSTFTDYCKSSDGCFTIGAGTVNINANKAITMNCTSNQTPLNFDANATLNGPGTLNIVSQGGMSATISIPRISNDGTLNLKLNKSSSGTPQTFQLTGALSNLDTFTVASNYGNRVMNFNTQDHNVKCNTLIFETNGVGTIELNVNCGSSTFDITEYNVGPASTVGLTLNMQTSTWTVDGDFDIGSNTTVDAGTAQITFDGATAVTLTSAGETLPEIIIAKAANGVTLSDDLTCGNLTLTSGNFDMNGQALSCANFVDNSTDTKTMDANVTVSGTGTYNQDITFGARLILTGDTTQTIAAGKTVTITTYTAADMDGETWASDTPGSAANLTVPAGGITVSNCTFTDIDASGGGEIDATNGGTDGGGNTNIVFVTAGSAGGGKHSRMNIGIGIGIGL